MPVAVIPARPPLHEMENRSQRIDKQAACLYEAITPTVRKNRENNKSFTKQSMDGPSRP
jgi:hypothetical protein